MENKIYRTKHGKFTVLEVYKWLRTVGTSGVDYVVHQANYREIEISFNNERAELEYIMRYHWTDGK